MVFLFLLFQIVIPIGVAIGVADGRLTGGQVGMATLELAQVFVVGIEHAVVIGEQTVTAQMGVEHQGLGIMTGHPDGIDVVELGDVAGKGIEVAGKEMF